MSRRVVISYVDHRPFQNETGQPFAENVVNELTTDLVHAGTFHDRDFSDVTGIAVGGFMISKELGETLLAHRRYQNDPSGLLDRLMAALQEQVRK